MRRERHEIKTLIEEHMEAEISIVRDKYKPLLDKLKYTFSIQDIEAQGWVRAGRYLSRGNNYEYEYNKRIPDHDFWVRTVNVVFDEISNITELITNSGCQQRNIIDLEDLNHYFINNE